MQFCIYKIALTHSWAYTCEKGEVMKLVIAGNYQQYKNYLQENKLSSQDAKYISRSEQLRGYRDVEIVRVGEWWLNPCAYDSYLQVIERPTPRTPDAGDSAE